jgi:hypothetical protein
MLGANDLELSKIFYDAVLGTLGTKPGMLINESIQGAKSIYK